MRPAKDILFDFIRSRRDTGWPVSLLTIYNKYSTYSKIDSSKIISEITIVQELEEKDIQISDDAKSIAKKDIVASESFKSSVGFVPSC